MKIVARFLGALVIGGVLILEGASDVHAQAASSASREKKKTTIDFEDELIEGEVKKPELFYLLQKKQFNFKKLIRLRENFLPEMRKTAEEIKGGGRP